MKKRFLLFSALLSLLLLTGCTKQLTDKPLTLSFPEETAAFTGTLSKGTYTGTVLGDGCVVGAGAVVAGKFEDNCVIAGNPARVIKRL